MRVLSVVIRASKGKLLTDVSQGPPLEGEYDCGCMTMGPAPVGACLMHEMLEHDVMRTDCGHSEADR